MMEDVLDTIFPIGFLPGNQNNCHFESLWEIPWPVQIVELQQKDELGVLLQKEVCPM